MKTLAAGALMAFLQAKGAFFTTPLASVGVRDKPSPEPESEPD